MTAEIYYDPIAAETAARERSMRLGKPIAVVFHTQLYAHILMGIEAARVCIEQSDYGIASQSSVADGGYYFDWSYWQELKGEKHASN